MTAIEYLRAKWTRIAHDDPHGVDQVYYDRNRDAAIAELVADKPSELQDVAPQFIQHTNSITNVETKARDILANDLDIIAKAVEMA